MKGWIVLGLVLGILCVTGVWACSDRQTRDQDAARLEQPLSVLELLNCKSLVPETENSFVHIGGGFFAYFNRRDGGAKKNPTPAYPDSAGSLNEHHCCKIRFSLRELGYESRLVYLPKGSLLLETAEGRTLVFSMEVLDYVQVPGRKLPCYRLIASGSEKEYSQAILICCTAGTESP